MNQVQAQGLERKQQLRRLSLRVKEVKEIQVMGKSRNVISVLDHIFLMSVSGLQVLASPVVSWDTG